MFNGFSHSVVGASHLAKGTICQDCSACRTYDNYGIAVVADGHGSKKHFRSDKGSEMAVKAALGTVDEYYRNADEFEESFLRNPDDLIKKIEKTIISRWNRLIFRHFQKNPITSEEKSPFTEEEFRKIKVEQYYGTTLIIAVLGRKFTFGMQIGDGSFVVVHQDGSGEMPIAYDENAPANVTASMCNSQTIRLFNSFYTIDEKPLAVYVSTDGLYTSFMSDEDFLDYHTIVTSQLVKLPAFDNSIKKNMIKRSQSGTQDDVSFSCVFDNESLFANIATVQEQVESNKNRAAMRKAEQQARIQKQRLKNAMQHAKRDDDF